MRRAEGRMVGDDGNNSRDADLTLFNEMRARQRRKFIYSPPEDASSSSRNDDGFLSTSTGLSPSRPNGNNAAGALPMDANKNDYDWLLTPPTTPLFPSLDDDALSVVNLLQRRVLPTSASAAAIPPADNNRVTQQQELLSQQQSTTMNVHQSPNPRDNSATTASRGGRPSPPPYMARSSSAGRATRSNLPPAATTTSSSNCSSNMRPSSPSPCRQTISPARSRSVSRSPTPSAVSSSPSATSSGSVFTAGSSSNSRGRGNHHKLQVLSPPPLPHRWDASAAAMGLSTEPPPNLRTTPSNRSSNHHHHRSGSSQMLKVNVSPAAAATPSRAEAAEGNSSKVHSHLDQQQRVSPHSNRSSFSSGQQKSRSSPSRRPRSPEAAATKCGLPPEDHTSPIAAAAAAAGRASPARRDQMMLMQQPIHTVVAHHGRMPSFPATKPSSGRPMAPRRNNPQPMFRPLLTSAPMTSSRGSMKQQPSPTSAVHHHFGSTVEPENDDVPAAANSRRNVITQQAVIVAAAAKCRSKSMEIDFMRESLAAADPPHTTTEGTGRHGDSLREELEHARFPSPDPLTRHEQRLGDRKLHHHHQHGSKRSLTSSARTEDMALQQDSSSCASNLGCTHDLPHSADVLSSPKSMCDSSPSIRKPEDVNVMNAESKPGLEEQVLTDDKESNDGVSDEKKSRDCHSSNAMEIYCSELLAKSIASSNDGTMESNHQGGHLCKLSTLKRNVTLEEATETILFCNSIVHELVHSASAAAALQNEKKQAPAVVNASTMSSRREFVTLFGFSTGGGGERKRPIVMGRNQKRRQPAVQERSVQKQRMKMVHRQSAAITMQQSSMERIENAVVMGNPEEKAAAEEGSQKQSQCTCGGGCCIM